MRLRSRGAKHEGAPRRAAIALACALAALPVIAGAQAPLSAAQRHYIAGTELLHAGQPARALAEFRASVTELPSPNTFLYIARCLDALGRYAAAVQEYEAAAREASVQARHDRQYEPTREAATTELNALLGRLGHVSVTLSEPPPGVRVTIGGEEVPRGGLDVATPVAPGTLVVEVTAPGFRTVRRELTVAAGQRVALEIALERDASAPVQSLVAPPAVPSRGTRHSPHSQARGGSAMALGVAGWAVAGFGVASFGAATGFWFAAAERYRAAQDLCGEPPCSGRDLDRVVAAGRTWQVLTHVALGSGVLGVALGAALVGLGARTTRAGVRVSLGPSSVMVAGSF